MARPAGVEPAVLQQNLTQIEGSLSLERMLDAIYGADRVTKGNGTYVEADSDRRQDRPGAAKRSRARGSKGKTTLNAVVEAALARYVADRKRPTETKGV